MYTKLGLVLILWHIDIQASMFLDGFVCFGLNLFDWMHLQTEYLVYDLIGTRQAMQCLKPYVHFK